MRVSAVTEDTNLTYTKVGDLDTAAAQVFTSTYRDEVIVSTQLN
jgi:hypothetical protein